MLPTQPQTAIAPQLEDELTRASIELATHLEETASLIAPDPSFDYVRVAHQEFAMLAAREFNRIRLEQILYELSQGRRILEAEERLSRRKEFSQWKQALSATAADIRKWAKLVLTFGSFPVEKITAIASAVNIYALCTPKFTTVVQKLKELPALTTDIIKQLVKEARPPRKPKQQQSTVELARDVSGGVWSRRI